MLMAAERVDSITVSGRLLNVAAGAPLTVTVCECDIHDSAARMLVEADSAGYFKTKVPLSFPHTFVVIYNRRVFMNAFAEPGDSIDFVLDTSTRDFTVSGDHMDFNKQYAAAHQDLAHLLYDLELPGDSVAVNEYLPAFKGVLASVNDSVAAYVRSHGISQDVADFLFADAKYGLANLACTYMGQDSTERMAFFTDPVFDIYNPVNTKVMIFPYHLSALLKDSPEYVNSMPKSLTRDIAYAALDGEIVPERGDFTIPAYYDRIYGWEGATLDLSQITPGEIIVLEGDSLQAIPDADPIKWLEKRFSGRPIFLDISATWCGPCRGALLGSEGTREALKDSDVVFAVIWVKSELDAWKELAPRITNAVHIFLPDELQSDRLWQALALHGVPSYFIIDREGIISPSEESYMSPSLGDYLKGL